MTMAMTLELRPVTPARLALGASCLLGLAALAVAGAFTANITPAEPAATNAARALLQPSAMHPFGTDALGRDVAARVLAAAGTSIAAAAGGFALGMASAWIAIGARAIWPVLDAPVRGLETVLCAFPPIVLALLAAASAGGVEGNVWAVAAVTGPAHLRALRQAVDVEMQAPHGVALRLSGYSDLAIVLRDALPEGLRRMELPPLARPAGAIGIVATVGLLGLPVTGGDLTWGALIAEGVRDGGVWWTWAFPAAAVVAAGAAAQLGTGRFGAPERRP